MLKKRTVTDDSELDAAAALSAFRWSDGSGCHHDLGGAHFSTREQAARGWALVRRAAWARTSRFQLPAAARYFDGLTLQGLDALRLEWGCVRFDLGSVLLALAVDRTRLAAFRATPGAASVVDILEIVARDLDAVEQTARALADVPATEIFRPYPFHLNTSRTYGALAPDGGTT